MIRMLVLLKRRDDLDPTEFRRRYEENHAPFAQRYFSAGACRYVRRYLANGPESERGSAEWDVLTEVWFPDGYAYAAARRELDRPEARTALRADEAELFTPERRSMFVIEESDTDLPLGQGRTE